MQYIKNEWIKIWSQKNAWIMLIISLFILTLIAVLDKNFSDDSSTKEERLAANEEQLKLYNEWLTAEENTEDDIQYYSDEILKIQYRIDHDLPSEYSTSFSNEMETSISVLTKLIAIFTITIAAGIVSNEFKAGTIKMLLTRPVARWKILFSKLITSILFGLALFVVSLAFSAILNVILFGTATSVDLSVINGQVVEIENSIIKDILYQFASILMIIIFAFMLGSLFSSSTLAVTLALFIFLMGKVATIFIAKYEFAKFIWFANDLSYYAPGNIPPIEDLTFTFSLIVNIVYAIIFLAVTFTIFNKRDITA